MCNEYDAISKKWFAEWLMENHHLSVRWTGETYTVIDGEYTNANGVVIPVELKTREFDMDKFAEPLIELQKWKELVRRNGMLVIIYKDGMLVWNDVLGAFEHTDTFRARKTSVYANQKVVNKMGAYLNPTKASKIKTDTSGAFRC